MKYSKICIIDDNEVVCNSLIFLFNSFYQVKVKAFQNPSEFLKEFSSEWVGCLIIDLFMPSINGIELMKELEKRNCHLKVIIMSGHATEEIAQQSLNAGAYAFISKPFKTEHLLEKVSHILGLAKTTY